MAIDEKALIKAKRIECGLGVFFLIPAMLCAIAFTLAMLGVEGGFVELRNLNYRLLAYFGDNGGGMSAAPIYAGILAIVGACLIKDSLKYVFLKEGNNKNNVDETK